jgi:hypothetical protein
MIRKLRNKELWRLYSLREHKNLGTYPSKELAIKREGQIIYFKGRRKK